MKKYYLFFVICIFCFYESISQDLISGGSNSWRLHTPDDGRTSLFVAPGVNGSAWDFSKQTEFSNDGQVKFSNTIRVQGPNDFDGTTGINITNGANDYGRTQLRLTGRFYNGNGTWNMNGRNNILFARNAASPGVNVGSLGTDEFAIQHNLPTNELGILSATRGSTPLMVINQNGNIGIGAVSPSVKLEVIGPGGSSTDLVVNGRVATGDATNNGGMWVNSGRSMFVGQRGSNSLGFYNNGTWRLIVNDSGNVGIGTTDPGSFRLAVEGKVGAREVVVTSETTWPDYVFEPSYNLPSLSELEQYIKTNKHLPEVPTASEVKENGLSLGEMNAILLKKVEELTLHLIEQEKRLIELEKKCK